MEKEVVADSHDSVLGSARDSVLGLFGIMEMVGKCLEKFIISHI